MMMTNNEILDSIRTEFHNRVTFSQKRSGLYQLVAPFYHEDGDMYDLFIEDRDSDDSVFVTDKGLTLMRLSYSYELDTPNKERIYRQILRQNDVQEDDGELFTRAPKDRLYEAILRFTKTVTAITNMSLYRRDVIRSLFYEMLAEYVTVDLARFQPETAFLPLDQRDDLEVDFRIPATQRPLFLFGVKDGAKARLVTISCLEFLRNNVPFRSVVVHENFEALSAKDRRIITNVVDKQFTDFDDFEKSGSDYIQREVT